MSFNKSDGSKIKITFNQPITTGQADEESHFTVTVKEALYSPDGALRDIVKGVNSTYAFPGVQESADLSSIVLQMNDTERFESAIGSIIVAYDGTGTLAGAGGPVEAFSQEFTPTNLIWKGDQNDQEHIEIASVVASGSLIPICYTDTKCDGRIDMNVTAVGVLTAVQDL